MPTSWNRLGAWFRGSGARRAADFQSVGSVRPDPYDGTDMPRYEHTWIDLAQLGSHFPPYEPTYAFEGFVNQTHRNLAVSPLKDDILVDCGIPGWLRRADALKLYELAYFSPGDILEIGTHKGLSGFVMASAIRDSARSTQLLTVEIEESYSSEARRHLSSRRVDAPVRYIVGDAADVCRQLVDERRRFSFIFVDHTHEYAPMVDVCRLLSSLIYPRGFCLFHDYNDARNPDPAAADYGVPQAVEDGLRRGAFEFHGIFGCTALYRARLEP